MATTLRATRRLYASSVSASTAPTATTPSSLPTCAMGTRPTIIMSTTTTQSSTAVDRFSSMMRKASGSDMQSMYLNAFLSAPRSPCMALSIWASASIMVPLAISDGWKVKPSIGMTRCAPLTVSPAMSTHTSVRNDTSSRNGVMSLK